MTRFVVARFAQGVVIVFLVASFTFVLIHVAPGDPFLGLAERSSVPSDVREQLRVNFGLDRPLAEQYVRYLGNVARGDFGYSFSERRPVAAAIVERVPNTLLLAVAGLAIAFGLGIPLGAWQGWRSGSTTDHTLTIVSLAIYSLPVFWVGMMLQLVLGVGLGLFPMGNAIDPIMHSSLGLFGRTWDRLVHLALPAITLGLAGAATFARFQRTAMLDTIVQDFVRTARSKGLSERTVLFGHTLRAALLPTITLFGLAFPILLSGAVLVEAVFSWPGMGRLAVDAISTRDYYVVTGTTIVSAAMVVVGNMVADILYRVADPRTQEIV